MDGVAGMTTYRLSLALGSSERNVYTIFGITGHPLQMPAAFQAPAPFGGDVGGTNPAL